jgi:hypothetical protein
MSAALIEALTDYTTACGGTGPFVTAIPGVTILCSDRPKRPMPLIRKPALCLVAQGTKQGMFGETQLEYRAGQALVVGFETPTCAWVSQASADEPFLGIVIEFDVVLMREVLARSAVRSPWSAAPVSLLP